MKREFEAISNIKTNVFNSDAFEIIAGPCAIENEEMLEEIASFISGLGCKYIRGGVFKARTSPYSFQGLGIEGLKMFRTTANKYGLKIVSEITDIRQLDKCLDLIDIVQIGSRNMYNYEMLKEIGRISKPVLLKRGMSATIEEFLYAAEYIATYGNDKIILCERGIRSFDKLTRYTLDISAVPIIRQYTSLPVIIDPSHAAGRRDIINDLSMAAVAIKASGLIIEMHPLPEKALCDGSQSLNLKEFALLHKNVTTLYDKIKEANIDMSRKG